MASFNWKTGASGDWATAANWFENNVPDTSTADVTIDTAPLGTAQSYTVKIAAGSSELVNSLTLGGGGTNLEIDGTLTFAPGSAGALGFETGNSKMVINGGTVVNAGLIYASIQTTGNVLFNGANPLYVAWELQVVAGTTTLDTASLGPYDAAKHILFDGIYEALGAGQTLNLGGKGGGLTVAAETLTGPKAVLTPNYWTQLIFDDVGSQINEWNGTSYVSIETTLKLIESSAYVTVTGGRNYTTTNALAIGKDGVFEQAGGTLSTGGLTVLVGGLLLGGITLDGAKPSAGRVLVQGAVVNNGEIVSEGAGLAFHDAITGTGGIAFNRVATLPGFNTPVGPAAPGTLEVAAVGAGQTVTMFGGDTLMLDAPAAFAGVIAGFAASDVIVLNSATAVTSVAYAAGANGVGTLTLSNGATTLGTLALTGNFAGQAFSVAAGAAAGSYNVSVGAIPPIVDHFHLFDTTTGVSSIAAGEAYAGPVLGLQNQYIYLGADNLNISAIVPNSFIRGGPGLDAIDVSAVGGTNVLDGSTGSNFLVGGTGNDTFFVDDRAATADIWSTVVNFHTGDAATIFGVTSTGFALDYEDGQGAAGATGLTLHAIAAGKPIASITLAGYSKADLGGRLGVSFGTETNGDNYMYIKGN